MRGSATGAVEDAAGRRQGCLDGKPIDVGDHH